MVPWRLNSEKTITSQVLVAELKILKMFVFQNQTVIDKTSLIILKIILKERKEQFVPDICH